MFFMEHSVEYPPALALAAPQASRIRSQKLCVFLIGRTVIKICKLNFYRYHTLHLATVRQIISNLPQKHFPLSIRMPRPNVINQSFK